MEKEERENKISRELLERALFSFSAKSCIFPSLSSYIFPLLV